VGVIITVGGTLVLVGGWLVGVGPAGDIGLDRNNIEKIRHKAVIRITIPNTKIFPSGLRWGFES
jgi:hypothetical protein